MDIDSALQNATVSLVNDANSSDTVQAVVEQPIAHPTARAFFRMDDANLNNQSIDRMNEVWDWAKEQANSDDELDVLQVLRDVRFKLGANPTDTSYLDNFYQYMKISKDVNKLTTQLKAMEK